MNWSLVYTFFRTLSLSHLERSLFSLSKQTKLPEDMIFFENNTDFSEEQIKAVVAQHFDLSRWRFYFNKHGDPRKTSASWCQNHAIKLAKHDVFVLGKADLIYSFDFCERVTETFAYHSHYGNDPMHFTSTHLMQMAYHSECGKPHEQVDHAKDLESLNWREDPQRLHKNVGGDYGGSQYQTATHGDAPSFCTTKIAMEAADWYDEDLLGWGYWQISLQSDMATKGVQFHIIPETLIFHMLHSIEGPERSQQLGMQEFNQSRRRKGIRNNYVPD